MVFGITAFGASLFSATALGIGEVLGTYMNTWFWEFPSTQIGFLAAVQVVPLLLGFSMVGPISRRWDKRKAVIGLSLFAIFWGPLPVLMRFVGLAPENGSPLLLPFIMAHGLFLVAAAISFTGKAVSGFGNFLGGVVLDVIDFPVGEVDAAVGNVPEETIRHLGIAAGPGLVVFYLCGLWCVTHLRLTRERYAEISEILAERGSRPAGDAEPRSGKRA